MFDQKLKIFLDQNFAVRPIIRNTFSGFIQSHTVIPAKAGTQLLIF